MSNFMGLVCSWVSTEPYNHGIVLILRDFLKVTLSNAPTTTQNIFHKTRFLKGQSNLASGQSVSVSHRPHHKKKIPYVTFKSKLFQFKTASPVTTGLGMKCLSIFLIGILSILKGCPCTGSLILLVLAKDV